MNQNDLAILSRKFPISEAARRRNQAGGKASSAKPEQAIRHESVAEKEGKTKNSTGGTGCHQARSHIGICLYRTRLLDPDNPAPKYFIDSLRYAGLIPNDRPEDITLEVSQVKVSTKAEERTEIEIL